MSDLKNNKIKVALPDSGIIDKIQNGATIQLDVVQINHYIIVEENESSPYNYKSFKEAKNNSCDAYIATMTYQQLLSYQRYINLSCHTEEYHELDDSVQYLIYHKNDNELGSKLWDDNKKLEEMIPARKEEWDTIADIQVLIPVKYDDIDKLRRNSKKDDRLMNDFLASLDYRTHAESGIPKGLKEQDCNSFKDRIERFYLGKIKIIVMEENDSDNYDSKGEEIGAPAEVDIMVSIDKKSNCGVFSIISLSTPFLLSHFMDNVIRNHIYFRDGNQDINLFNYLEELGIHKRGTAKLFVTIPQEKGAENGLKNEHIASLIMSETIYPDGEELGTVIDEKILEITTSEKGMGQYNRAFVCAHTNVLMQFIGKSFNSVSDRMSELAVTFF